MYEKGRDFVGTEPEFLRARSSIWDRFGAVVAAKFVVGYLGYDIHECDF